MRRKQLGMSPANIAIAVAVTIEAIAGTGGMKKVTGTSSAVAIVAVSPGTAPTKRPNKAEAKMTQSTYGSKTSPNAAMTFATLVDDALQHAPGQRNAQELVEREMDDDRGEQRDRYGEGRPGAERERPREEEEETGQVKAERLGEHQGKREPRDDKSERRERTRPAQPFAGGHPGLP